MNYEALDRQIIIATQAGLPVCVKPYELLANDLNISESLLIERLKKMQETGTLRRVALVPNHYKIGYTANGMSVWKIKKESIDRVGELFGKLSYVSHCYERVTYDGVWEYNIFAMVHGRKKAEVLDLVAKMKSLITDAYIGHDVLFSEKILKKTGLRIGGERRV